MENTHEDFELTINNIKQTSVLDVLQELKRDIERLRVIDNKYVKLEDIMLLINLQISSVSK